MEHNFTHRSFWTNDSKFLHHHVADFFTSVQVTQDVAAGTSFGPCVLYNTFYDTIAFIALKSSDKRNKSYVFRVDPEAMKGSPLVVSWLRLVQAAMSTEDQNTEAYLKSGQLHFRTIRDVKQGEELLVWYDEELSLLLGFGDIKSKAMTDGFTCTRCKQAFKNENPFLAHCRFLCAQEKVDIIRPNIEQKQAEVKGQRKVFDFHNIARDLEDKINISSEDMATTRKRKHDASLSPRSKKHVLLEKININNHINTTNKDYSHFQHLSESTIKLDADNVSINETTKSSAFTTVKRPQRLVSNPENSSQDVMAQNQTDRETDAGLRSDYSAFSFVLPKSAHSDQKSAFCEPNRRSDIQKRDEVCAPPDSDNISDTFKSKPALGYRNVLASHLFHGDLPGTHAGGVMANSLATGGPFYYAPEHWTGAIGGQLQSASSLTLLPPTYTPLGVSVQNWCAKCNLSFRMTSDLVFHMRSHHKKEFAAEAQVRRRREEKLTCPICHEYFRERHHLSRHMTSHN